MPQDAQAEDEDEAEAESKAKAESLKGDRIENDIQNYRRAQDSVGFIRLVEY